MTNQEAAEMIRNDMKLHHDYLSGEYRKALKMAISALQMQDSKTRSCDTCKHNPVSKKWPCVDCDMREPADRWEPQEVKNSTQEAKNLTQNALDTINRQAAINTLLAWIRPISINNQETIESDEMIFVRNMLEALPTAQPEPHWIPVSERPPEDGEDCLVSIRCPNEFFLVDMATYSTDLFKVDEERFFDKRGESGWYYLSPEYGYCEMSNVIAWMPVPRPYKEIKDEGSN